MIIFLVLILKFFSFLIKIYNFIKIFINLGVTAIIKKNDLL